MKILVTGADGFIGKNLCYWIKQAHPDYIVFRYDTGLCNSLAELCRQADFVFHLAGVNRTADNKDFEIGNKELTKEILQYCLDGKQPPVLISSSVQAALCNPYGESKKAAEDAVFEYGNISGSQVYVYRLPGVFGKWCRPNYNSVVATFCYNIANDLPIEIHDPSTQLNLAYIDDVCNSFTKTINGNIIKDGDFCVVEPVHHITLSDLADTMRSFRYSRDNLMIHDMSDPLTRKLHSTYLSYLPDFSYKLNEKIDERGVFSEFIKNPIAGQVSINVTKPGYTKGNHWHHTKTEKFLTVSGQGVVRFRKLGETKVHEYHVNGDVLQVVDIPPGYTHSLTNTGACDLVTVMWVDELFNPNIPDTYYEEVILEGRQ